MHANVQVNEVLGSQIGPMANAYTPHGSHMAWNFRHTKTLPIEGPSDSQAKNQRLESMLNNHTSGIVIDPSILQRLPKKDTKPGWANKDGVWKRQRASIAREHSRKRHRYGMSRSLVRPYVGLYGSDEHGYPE